MTSVALRIPEGDFIPPASLAGRVRLENDLLVLRGQIVGLYGRSGIGKSVFVRRIVDRSREVAIDPLNAITGNRLLFIPQDVPLFQERTLAQNAKVLSGGSRFEKVLESAGVDLVRSLSGRAQFSPQTLSGGERRLFTLTCVLQQDADCLIIDETLVSMDPERLNRSLDLLTEFAQSKRCGVLLITHDDRVLRRCSEVYEMRWEHNTRILARVSHAKLNATLWLNRDRSDAPVPDVHSRHQKALSMRQSAILRMLGGCAVALFFLIGLLISPRLLQRPGIQHIFPTFSELWNETIRLGPHLLYQGLWTLKISMLAWSVSIVIVACFAYITLSAPAVRPVFVTSWISLQTLPVLVVTPLFALIFDVYGAPLEITIGVFISVFPLGLIISRSLSAVPLDYFRAHNAQTAYQRFTVALHASWGNIVRGVLSCTPLTTIGVVVAEYLAGKDGLGHHLNRNISATKLTVPYIYAVSIVIVSICLFFLVGVFAAYSLPKDVTTD